MIPTWSIEGEMLQKSGRKLGRTSAENGFQSAGLGFNRAGFPVRSGSVSTRCSTVQESAGSLLCGHAARSSETRRCRLRRVALQAAGAFGSFHLRSMLAPGRRHDSCCA